MANASPLRRADPGGAMIRRALTPISNLVAILCLWDGLA